MWALLNGLVNQNNNTSSQHRNSRDTSTTAWATAMRSSRVESSMDCATDKPRIMAHRVEVPGAGPRSRSSNPGDIRPIVSGEYVRARRMGELSSCEVEKLGVVESLFLHPVCKCLVERVLDTFYLSLFIRCLLLFVE